MPSKCLRLYTFFAGAVVALLAAGCQRGEPGATKVEAANFAGWHAQATENLTTDQGTALESALQELKLQAMTEGATGSDGIDQAVYQKVNGKTVNEAIQLGYGAKLARLQAQRDQIDTFLSQNAQLKTKEGDTASADYLAHRHDDQKAQRDEIDRQIADTKDQLKRLNIPVPALPPSKPASTAATNAAPAATGTTTPSTSTAATEQPDTAPVPVQK